MDNLDEKMKAALLKRAEGFDYEEKTVIAGKNGKPEKVKIVRKHMPPDVESIRIVQRLRERGRW